MRITVACPQALIADANQLAMVLNGRAEDALTFRQPEWQDAAGNAYACASFEANDTWVNAALSPLSRPAWDSTPPYTINMAGAERAHGALALWISTLDADHPPSAAPGALVALGSLTGSAALAALGLSQPHSTDAAFVLPHLSGG